MCLILVVKNPLVDLNFHIAIQVLGCCFEHFDYVYLIVEQVMQG